MWRAPEVYFDFIRLLPYLPWRGLAAGGVQKAASAITLKGYRR